MEKDLEHLDSLIQETEESFETADDDAKPQFEEKLNSLKSLKEEFGKSKEISENQRIRAEKAESELKELQKKLKEKETQPPKTEEDNISQADLLFIAKSAIHEDDIEELLNIAKSQKKNIKEVYQLPWVKSFLAERQEERKTAEATSTKSKGMGVKSPSSQDLLDKAQKSGELPEKTEDMEKLIDARLESKSGKK